jgi:hypothetical protein
MYIISIYSTLSFLCVHVLCTILLRQKKEAARDKVICLNIKSHELPLGYLSIIKVMNKSSNSPVYYVTRVNYNTAVTQHKKGKLSTGDNSHLDSWNFQYPHFEVKIPFAHTHPLHTLSLLQLHICLHAVHNSYCYQKLNVLFNCFLSTFS